MASEANQFISNITFGLLDEIHKARTGPEKSTIFVFNDHRKYILSIALDKMPKRKHGRVHVAASALSLMIVGVSSFGWVNCRDQDKSARIATILHHEAKKQLLNGQYSQKMQIKVGRKLLNALQTLTRAVDIIYSKSFSPELKAMEEAITYQTLKTMGDSEKSINTIWPDLYSFVDIMSDGDLYRLPTTQRK